MCVVKMVADVNIQKPICYNCFGHFAYKLIGIKIMLSWKQIQK